MRKVSVSPLDFRLCCCPLASWGAQKHHGTSIWQPPGKLLGRKSSTHWPTGEKVLLRLNSHVKKPWQKELLITRWHLQKADNSTQFGMFDRELREEKSTTKNPTLQRHIAGETWPTKKSRYLNEIWLDVLGKHMTELNTKQPYHFHLATTYPQQGRRVRVGKGRGRQAVQGTRWGCTLDGMLAHHRADIQAHSRTTGNLTACVWTVGGNRKKPHDTGRMILILSNGTDTTVSETRKHVQVEEEILQARNRKKGGKKQSVLMSTKEVHLWAGLWPGTQIKKH